MSIAPSVRMIKANQRVTRMNHSENDSEVDGPQKLLTIQLDWRECHWRLIMESFIFQLTYA